MSANPEVLMANFNLCEIWFLVGHFILLQIEDPTMSKNKGTETAEKYHIYNKN